MRSWLIRAGIVAGVLFLPSPASAQATGTVLVGVTTLDAAASSVSVAFGYGGSLVGYEVEYLVAWRGGPAGRSSGGGIFANLVVRPVTIGSVQVLAIGGIGMWGETLAGSKGTGAISARDLGVGVTLGPSRRLRVRLDYRLFMLGETEEGASRPSRRHPQRLSAGVHLAF